MVIVGDALLAEIPEQFDAARSHDRHVGDPLALPGRRSRATTASSGSVTNSIPPAHDSVHASSQSCQSGGQPGLNEARTLAPVTRAAATRATMSNQPSAGTILTQIEAIGR
jgi:hypothetical protein